MSAPWVRDRRGEGARTRQGQASTAVTEGTRAAADVDRRPGTAGVPVGQRQESAPVRF